MRFAPDGGAVPGDRIVGILTPGEGVTIYPIQSPALAAFDNEPERWLDVRWDIDAGAAALPGPHRAAIHQRAGHARRRSPRSSPTTTAISTTSSMKRRTQDFTDMLIDLAVWDLKHLNAIIAELRAKRVISRVERVTG